MFNVISLFDGISCGQVALRKLNIKVDKYYAAEINKDSMQIAKKNFPNTIHLGDVLKIRTSEFPKIDLLIGGSPCQDLSGAKPDGKGLKGEKSRLFYEFVRILKEVNPKWFLLENVIMKKEWQDIISNLLGVEPIEINSSLVSAQNRRRLYWTNIPNISKLKDKGIKIKDIIFDDNYKVFSDERIENTKVATKNYLKWDLSGKRYWSQQDRGYYKNGKLPTLPRANPSNKLNIVLENGKYRRLHPIEAERAQTLPDKYTEGLSDNKRLAVIGDGWTVDVISHILSHIPLAENSKEDGIPPNNELLGILPKRL